MAGVLPPGSFVTSPDNRSFGAELEAVVNPVEGLLLQGNATVLEGELGGGVDTLSIADRRCSSR